MIYAFVSGWKRSQGNGGISQYILNKETGELKFIRSILDDIKINVTYFDRKNNILYALNEVCDHPGYRYGGGGRIFLIKFAPESGEIVSIDDYPTNCSNPCNMAISKDETRMIITSHGTRNYVSVVKKDANGEIDQRIVTDDTPVMLYELDEKGVPGKILDIDQHVGCGPLPKQTISRPHSAAMDPSGSLYCVCDKGNDHVYMYRINDTKLEQCTEPVALPPGSAPRYCVFHPSLPYIYVNSESSGDIYMLRYSHAGKTELVDCFSEIPPGFEKQINTEQQGIAILPNGEALYSVVHDPNMVFVWKIDNKKGTLSLVQTQVVDDSWPRGIAVTSDGKMLATACAGSGKVITYHIKENGEIIPTNYESHQDNAAFITFWEI